MKSGDFVTKLVRNETDAYPSSFTPRDFEVSSLRLEFRYLFHFYREIHPLDPQPHRHSMLVPRVCAPRVTRCSLGKYWSRDWFRGNFSLTQGLSNQQAANPGVHTLSMTHSGVRQQKLMTHAQCPLPVYYSQISTKLIQI